MAGATLRHTAWILRGNPLTAVAAAGVVLLVLLAIFGPSIVPYDPIASNVAAIRSVVSLSRRGSILSSQSRRSEFPLCWAP
jgi:hypothetical protein